MKIIFGFRGIRRYRKPVVALGIFDGMHRAHRQILKYVVRLSRRIKGKSIVVTFWPHPQKEGSLYSLEHRLKLISQLGIEVCIVMKFNKEFSRILAGDFIKDILMRKIGAHYICVGKNFRFGKATKGNFKTLDRLSRIYNFKLKVFDVIKINHKPISSTYVRRLISRGDLASAQRLLCHPVAVMGSVIKGVSLGRGLGFPTANINPHHEILPPSGVYTVKVIFNNKKLNGVCYIGRKSAFKNHSFPVKQKTKCIEVHIFNFKKSIYGKNLEIEFIKRIRGEKRFACHQDLAEQIKKDVALAKKVIPPN
ncbi:MAG: bifunctional riboflavin kinase/FAD synthetase [Candidatus Omnitrophica bacterium]|nr:bifunctional riboflavin kinase/FAD synthetase [Candidatus Omnitrophota bacterium]MBU4473592.1 bifunctional riboflavin kinase/FAD synthetase [Candidatus Omnitrophota bacterium]MCG2706309.1 bifunctional riboflavin kinase/FAD synthetase [Candidatus Omnitrophota bacterium]